MLSMKLKRIRKNFLNKILFNIKELNFYKNLIQSISLIQIFEEKI